MNQFDHTHETLVARRPHHVAPSGLSSIRVVFIVHCFKTPIPGTSDSGLAVTIDGTMRTLRRAGVHCESWRVNDPKELWTKLENEEWHAARTITHVVLNTFNFADPTQVAALAARWVDTEFVVLNHTGLAYLQIDNNGQGVKRMRQLLDTQTSTHNVKLAGNNERFVQWIHDAYGDTTSYLPNLYDVSTFVTPVGNRKNHDPLRVGSFGVGRPWKNQLVTAEAALSLARSMGVSVELHVNTDPWKNYKSLTDTRAALFAGTHNKIVEIGWQWWPHFRRIISQVDVLISPSYDETFCTIVADGIAEGVPSVVSVAMEWAPHSWQVQDAFDPSVVTSTARSLLFDRVGAINTGRDTLTRFVKNGTVHWINYLSKGTH